MARKLEVEIVGDAGSLERAFRGASSSASTFSSKIGGGLAKVGKAAALAGVGITAGVTAALVMSSKAALDAEKSQARLDQAFRKANATAKERTAAMEAISTVSNKAALDDEDLADSLARLSMVTGDVGKAQQGMAVAADIARARNMSLEAATKVVEKAYLGNVGALKRIGIEIPKVTAAQDALKAAGGKVTDEQVKQAKALDDVATRQGAVAALQEKFSGAAEAYGKTSSGAIERFKVGVENLQESLGSKLLPVIGSVAGAAADFIDKFSRAEGAGAKFRVAMDTIKQIADKAWDALVTGVKAINWGAVANEVGAGARKVTTKIADIVGDVNWSDVGSKMGAGVSAAATKLAATLRNADFENAGGEIVKGVVKGFKDFVSGVDWGSVVVGMVKLLVAALMIQPKVMMGAGKAIGGAVLEGIGDGARDAWDAVRSWFAALPGKIEGFFAGAPRWLVGAGMAIIDGLWAGLRQKVDAMLRWVGKIGGWIKDHKGPIEKDAKLLEPEGSAIILGLQTGMQASWATVAPWVTSVGGGIVENFIRGVTEKQPQFVGKLAEAAEAAVTAAREKVVAYQDRFADTFGKLGDYASRAFEAQTQKILDKIGRQFDAKILKWQNYADALTPAEEQLKAIADAESARSRAADMAAAQAAVAAATTEQEKNAALEQLRQANLANTIAGLETQAATQRAAREKEAAEEIAALEKKRERAIANATEIRNQLKAKLDEQLANLVAHLQKHPEKWKDMKDDVVKLLGRYGADMKTAGQNFGEAFANGLKAAQAQVRREAHALADIVAQYLRAKSPTEKGPMSTLDTWWRNVPKTLAQGLRGAEGHMSGAMARASLQPAAPAAAGRAAAIHVTVNGVVGSPDRVADEIHKALLRKRGRVGELGLS